jgi:sodium/potassium/calcium exchanger 6
MGMVWIYFLINLVIDLLVLFGIQTGIYASLLGLTILSWGNSIGDAIASAAISRDGFSQMAFTGCISGALLNLLLGLGLTLLFAHRNNSDAGIDFKAVDNEGRATLLIILASMCTLLVLLSLIASENWSVKKWHAKIIFGLYFFTVGSAFIIYL